ncbi:hypothetical protein [Methanocrinis sp.]|uniref:hypothetical protein n=1 Tax=Methanocrinis sp. TaxID=3101522 RepID=UPI003D12F9A3
MIRNTILILASLILIAGAGIAENDAGLTGLWAFSCEADQISGDPLPLEEFSAALFMMGPAISGACTGETPDPWNGMVTGRLDGSGLDLEILLIKRPLTAARMTGSSDDSGDIAGTFVCSDETGSGWTGSFSASMTSPETALYEPAASDPLPFVPAVSGGISDFEEVAMAPPAEEEPKKRELQVISYTRDTIYARPVM